MHNKKIKSIIISSFIIANLIFPSSNILANELNNKTNIKDFKTRINENEEGIKLDKSINEEINISNVDNILNNKDLIKNVNKKELISRIGLDGLNEFTNTDAANNNFINWLLNNNEAMKYYLTGGLPSTTVQNSMGAYHYDNNSKVNKEKEISALKVWSKIWNSDNESKEGINLKIAIATALEFSSSINTWLTNKPLDPISRYNSFKNANKDGILFPCFKNLSIKDLRNVVNAKITDEDIIWLRQYIKDLNEGKEDAKFKWQHEHVHNPDLLSQDKIANISSTLQYTMKNPSGESVFKPGFYGENPSVSKVVEYGGVCGAISKFSTVACQVFGVPAYPVGQPKHCAFFHLNSKNNWQLGYDVFGWEKSVGYYTTIPYMLINEELNSSVNQDSYIKSEQLKIIAKNTISKEKTKELLNEAIRIEPINYMAFEDKINNMLEDKNTTLEDYRELNTQIINNFKNYPQVMENLLVRIREKVLNGDRKEIQAYVNEYEAALKQVSDYREKPYSNKLLSEMKQKNLYLATFSFDGENAGKLVGLKKGIDEYSIDGGKTYKLANEDSQKLTKEELSSLNSENDILVRVKGTKTPNTIQINKGTNVNISINDDENLIFGLDKTMEFSRDEGKTWTQYDGSNLGDLSKNVTLLIRKKETENTLSGAITTVIFTDKEVPKGLILHKDMKIKEFSSQQNNSNQSANNAIDGNKNTIWHTKWNKSDKTPFITIELNKEMDITKLSYTPKQSGNYNGNILGYNIYTSLDGKNYTKVKSGSWQSNRDVKFADFKQTKAKYVKLEVVNGVNGFATAADISLYTK
ncbi:discoidin domain-containing protein [Clostridium perfringens]|uniref:discoidin domain-containing protein n=1 Tax=Clostridium perfringens TaxID=1502 RepID=UPI0024BC5C94|nr:discoidin domain-containing protein [Clostridium perfringens]